MRDPASFAPLLEGFFTHRLMQQRQASAHTIASYRDTFRPTLTVAAAAGAGYLSLASTSFRGFRARTLKARRKALTSAALRRFSAAWESPSTGRRAPAIEPWPPALPPRSSITRRIVRPALCFGSQLLFFFLFFSVNRQ